MLAYLWPLRTGCTRNLVFGSVGGECFRVARPRSLCGPVRKFKYKRFIGQFPCEIGRLRHVALLMSPACGPGGRRLLLYFAEQHAPVTRSGSGTRIRLVANRNADGLRELGGPWTEVKEEPAAPRAAGGGHERKGPLNSRSNATTLGRRNSRFQANVRTRPERAADLRFSRHELTTLSYPEFRRATLVQPIETSATSVMGKSRSEQNGPEGRSLWSSQALGCGCGCGCQQMRLEPGILRRSELAKPASQSHCAAAANVASIGINL